MREAALDRQASPSGGHPAKTYREQSLLSQIILFLVSSLFLNVSLTFHFLEVVEDRVTGEEFKDFVLSLFEIQRPGFTRAPEDEVRKRLAKRTTLRGMINAVIDE